MTVKKVNKPVVHSVRYLKFAFGNFIQESGVSDGVEGFTKVQCNYGNIAYGLCDRRSVTACRSEMSAAVVEPVGRKAYWSWKSRQVGGSRNAG